MYYYIIISTKVFISLVPHTIIPSRIILCTLSVTNFENTITNHFRVCYRGKKKIYRSNYSYILYQIQSASTIAVIHLLTILCRYALFCIYFVSLSPFSSLFFELVRLVLD
ncbi:unnamed protein product [Tenebrio molitor]|nr:unnamed protein product [Tenebrio molitor]